MVPANIKSVCNSNDLAFVVDNVHIAHEKAMSLGYDVIEKPKDTSYGQKTISGAAPEGTLCAMPSLNTAQQGA
ncbi:hypothetical protein CS022_19015 [Veronia nyctiphanis]|uniref:Uncharacterized protein n=1 Tax=Veronia nyctiphanis TaxID=1278244 RepID=A0A4Q0YM29_9GAMM|nr:hypothetical protein CS022_19015 [Veronia nyctiphanis]